ncbi:MAG: cache domain-containing protein [Desulfobacterota bacterium]|nr:cache domain-containing protein [Thermodesulfobacteriota bacterium]
MKNITKLFTCFYPLLTTSGVRYGLPSLFVVLFFILIIFFYLIPTFEQHLIERKKEAVRDLVRSVWSLLETYHAQETTGKLSRAEAQQQALACIRSLRYGKSMKDYFWINDMTPRMIMHPYRSDLEGRDVSDFTDPDGNHFFIAAVNTVRAAGEGFISYKWQRHDDPTHIETKISCVKGFAPWGWIVGSGLYINDVYTEIKKMTRIMSVIAAGLLACMIGGYVILLVKGQRLEQARRTAELSLRESEEKLKSITENINIGVFRTTIEGGGHIIYANRALAEIFGADSQEELYALQLIDVYVNPTDRAALLSELFKKGQIKGYEVQLKNKRGEPVWCSLSARLLYDAEGHPSWIDGALEDISKRKQIEDALRESEQRLATVIDFLPDATFAVNRDKKVIAWNKAMHDLTGISAADILWEDYDAVSVAIYGEQRPLLIDLLFVDNKEIEARYTWVKRINNHILAEGPIPHAYRGKGAYAWGIAGYLYDQEGKIAGAIESIRDITERHFMEQELRESRERLDLIIKGASIGTWDWDITTGIVIVNERWAEILGYIPDKRGLHISQWQEMLHPEDAPDVLARLHDHLQNKTDYYQSEYRIKTQAGTWRWVLDCGRVVARDGNGTPLRAAGIILDIHERKTADENLRAAYEELRNRDEQLVQADKMASLGTLVAGVAHEINNPNNFVMLNTPLMQNIWNNVLPILDEYCREHGDFKVGGMPFSKVRAAVPALLAGILDGARRINDIVKELRDFARPEETVMNQRVDVNTVVKSAVDLLYHTIQKSTHSFSVSYAQNLPPITGNAQRIEQVVVNLLLNACQALPSPERAVRISTSCDADTVYIAVLDEGVGIAEDDLSRIMDPFFTTKRSSGGTGLGLSISYKIIQQHRGRITVQSTPGKGSVFTVALPVHPAAAHHKILVADDELVMRDIICSVLSNNPAWEVQAVENGTAACMMLGKWRPDLIILDINMPDMNGVEVCRRIKADPDFMKTQVIICTGHPYSKEMKTIREMGFVNVLSKPFQKEELMQAVASVLNMSGAAEDHG